MKIKKSIEDLIPEQAITAKLLLVMPLYLKDRLVAVRSELERTSEYNISMTEIVLLAIDEYLKKAEKRLGLK